MRNCREATVAEGTGAVASVSDARSLSKPLRYHRARTSAPQTASAGQVEGEKERASDLEVEQLQFHWVCERKELLRDVDGLFRIRSMLT